MAAGKLAVRRGVDDATTRSSPDSFSGKPWEDVCAGTCAAQLARLRQRDYRACFRNGPRAILTKVFRIACSCAKGTSSSLWQAS